MLRRRGDPPAAAPGAWAALIPPASPDARLAAYRGVLVAGDDCRAPGKGSPLGRPRLPPSLVAPRRRLRQRDGSVTAA